jgi:hypothetical protein
MRIQSVMKITLAALVVLMIAVGGAWADQVGQPMPKLVMEETAYSFDPVVDGTKITHDFKVRNEGDAVLNINKVKTG